jgi:hypothetical protein
MKKSEAGQALPLTVLFAAMVLLGGGYGLGIVHGVLQDQEQAQTAADAAALAGALGNEQAAQAVAEANGGRLIALTRPDGDTLATVRVGISEAKARAHQGHLQ